MRLRSWRCVVLTPLIGVKFCSDGTCPCEIGNCAKGSEGSTLQIGNRRGRGLLGRRRPVVAALM
eukprot:4525949-Prymnesium_polylepis.1